MHSKIFQITKNKLKKENFLTEDTLFQGEGSRYDYCSEIDEDERQDVIQILVNEILPKGMFELINDNILIYKGGIEKWKDDYISNIKTKTQELTPDNITEWIGSVYQLEKTIKNPLDTGFQFYFEEEPLQGYAEESYGLLCFINGLEKGARLYIGGVIDYHF